MAEGSFGIGFREAKKGFFDRAAVLDAMDKASHRVLLRFGAYVRRSARFLIRSNRKASKPGAPPNSHTGLLKQFILFSWDPSSRSVIIGPSKLNRRSENAPEVLEFGGTENLPAHKITVPDKKRPGHTVEVTIPAGPHTFAARPYMHPAYEANKSKLPEMWADAINKT